MWSVFGVLLGNLIGVLPGMGALTAISMLLPLTYVIAPIPAILMLAGIFYGSMYGGAIGAILLNLPSHPPHAVTCIDGYPMTKAGRGGAALGVTMMSSFFAASVGILIMIFMSPVLEIVAFKFGPTEISAIMLLGLLAGATMSRGSPLKGVAMTVFGLFVGSIGTDVISGTQRYTFGINELSDGIDLAALSLGLFGIADFLVTINRVEIKGQGAIEGVAAPEAAAHSKTQVDFIPTMSLGIPGDAVMALLLGALIIKGIQPGPQMISEHPDIFWGLIASFWIGNVLLIILNVPLIGVWVKLLQVPYRLLYPTALFFICIGVYSTHNSLFDVLEVAAFGVVGAIFLALDFPMAPIVLGYVLGPMLEENFRRAMLLSRGNLGVYLTRPIAAWIIAACTLLIVAQVWSYLRRTKKPPVLGSQELMVE